MGVPIKRVEYAFTLMPEQAELLDEALNKMTQQLSKECMAAARDNDMKRLDATDKQRDALLGMILEVQQGANVIQD